VEEGDYYTVDEVAKVLKLTPGRVRQMLRAGELEGDQDETGRWRIPMRAVHERLEDRPALGQRLTDCGLLSRVDVRAG
jgi:excisionase family DNA binding protein